MNASRTVDIVPPEEREVAGSSIQAHVPGRFQTDP
jgi:hypothetical protein